MAIYLGEVPFVFQQGDEAIVEAYLGEDLMWSKWVEWSYSDRRPSSGYSDGYYNTYELSYTLPNTTDYKIESISATGYCQTAGDEYLCGVQIQIYRNGAWSTVADSGTQANEAHASWTNTNEYTDITQVRAVKGGLALRSAVALSISGKQKGN